MHELLVVAGLQLVLQVIFFCVWGDACWRRRTRTMLSCCLRVFREGFLFYAIAGFVRPLGWHILRTVQAANESKASTLFADMEAALQGQSFQPDLQKVCS